MHGFSIHFYLLPLPFFSLFLNLCTTFLGGPGRVIYTYLRISYCGSYKRLGRLWDRKLFFFPLDILSLVPIDINSLLLCESTSLHRPLFLECFPVALWWVFQ